MERVKGYLAGVRIPSIQDLKSGDYFRSFLAKKDLPDGSYIKDFEGVLIKLQEILIWNNVTETAVWLVLSQLFLYQFCWSSTPIISSTAYVCLASYLYITWTQRIWPTIRIQPHAEDSEKFTPVHPDVLSAPELEKILANIKQKTNQIYSGLWILRAEEPLRFCLTSSIFFIFIIYLGTKISTAVLLHSLALTLFLLPPLFLHLSRKKQAEPFLLFVLDVVSSLTNLLIYTSKSAPPQESHDLDDFIPEHSKETLENLDISIKNTNAEKEPEDSLSLSLASDLKIPSHEEVDQPSSLALLSQDLEADLLPTTSNIVDDEVSEEEDLEGPVGRLGGVDDSDSDTADPIFSLSDVASNSLSSAMSSVLQSQVLASFSSPLSSSSPATTAAPRARNRRESEPDLEDFELISEDELDKASP